MAETIVPKPPPDERLVSVGPLTRLLTRPDIGALLGAIAVYFAFGYFARSVNWLGDPGIAAGWTDQAAQYGIVAVPVALLMIGGEFDLSAGVMIGSSGILFALLTVNHGWNVVRYPSRSPELPIMTPAERSNSPPIISRATGTATIPYWAA